MTFWNGEWDSVSGSGSETSSRYVALCVRMPTCRPVCRPVCDCHCITVTDHTYWLLLTCSQVSRGPTTHCIDRCYRIEAHCIQFISFTLLISSLLSPPLVVSLLHSSVLQAYSSTVVCVCPCLVSSCDALLS